MRTANAMQLKARIKARAEEANVSPQLMMQNYLLERLMERISLSEWRDRIVIKDGMLIGSLIGADKRSTKDLDATLRGFELTHESAERAFREIIAVELDDDIVFELVRTEDIREADDYPGIRVFLKANYAPMTVPLTVDVTTGDKITPEAVEYSYPLLFDDRSITCMAYPVETVLAEKLETVISRGVANTRPRDYYDIVMLWRVRRDAIDLATLDAALAATSGKRGSSHAMGSCREVMAEVAADAGMLAGWSAFTRRYSYAEGMGLAEACATVVEVMGAMGR